MAIVRMYAKASFPYMNHAETYISLQGLSPSDWVHFFLFVCNVWRVVMFLDRNAAADNDIPFHGLRVAQQNIGT